MIRPFLILWSIIFATQIVARTGAGETAPMSASLLENNVLRLRVPHVMGNFAEEYFFAAQQPFPFEQMSFPALLAGQPPINKPAVKLAGIILDLRSADGENDGLMSATNFFRDKQFPLVILVNGQTRGAAATLAADLRTAGDGILVGSTNFAGKTPDITVTVSVADENNFLTNPFFIPAAPKNVSPVSTNEFEEFVDHTSEDDLVRQRVKDGDEDSSATPRVAPSAPVIRDPALARALDLFKALAALHPSRG